LYYPGEEMVESLKTKAQLIEEITLLRQRNAELEQRKNSKTGDSQIGLEERYQTLIENIPDVTWISDEDGNTCFISPNVENIYGYTADEIYRFGSELFFKRIHPDDVEDVISSFKQFLSEGKPYDVIYRIKHKDGNWIWIHDRALKKMAIEGKVQAYGIFTDITKSKQAEEALKKSEDMFRNLYETSLVGLWRTRISDGKFYRANPTAVRILGFSSEQELMDNCHASDLYPAEDREEFLKQLEESGYVENFSSRFTLRDGTQKNISVSARIYPEEGFIEGSAIDITERKEVEDKLKESEEKFRALFEIAPVGIIFYDKDGFQKNVNQAGYEIFGYAEEADFRDYNFLTSGDLPEVPKKRLLNGDTISQEHPMDLEGGAKHPMKSGIIYVYQTMKAVYSSSGEINGFINITVDTTTRKNTELALMESEERFRALFNSSNDAIFVHQQDSTQKPNKFIEVNSAACKILGYSRDELLTMTPLDVTGVEPNTGKGRIEKVLTDGQLVFEAELISKSSKRTPVEISSHAFELLGLPTILSTARDITERKNSENELLKERDFNQTLIQSSPAFFAAIDADGKTIMMNKSMLKTLGYTRQEVNGTDYLNTFVFEEDQGKTAEIFSTIRSQKSFVVSENRIIAKDGQQFLVEWHGQPIFKETGELDYIFGFGVNVTEIRRAEDKLKESEEKFRTLYEMAPVGIVIYDKDGYMTNLNKTAIEIFGIPEASNFSEYNFLDELPEHEKNILFKGETISSEHLMDLDHAKKLGIIETNKSEIIYVYQVLKAVYSSSGEINGFINITLDITERIRTESQLMESENRYRALFNSSSDAIFVHQADSGQKPNSFIEVNNSACDMLGYSRDELLEMSPLEITNADPDLGKQRIKRIYSEGQLVFEAELITKKSKNIPVEISSHVFELNGKPTIISTARDITERKEAEKALVASEEKFRTLFETAPYGIINTDLEGFVESCNLAYLETSGYEKADIIGKHFIDLPTVRKGDIPKFTEIFADVLQGKIGTSLEVEWKRKDGAIRNGEIGVSFLEIEGKKRGVQAIITDITNRKRAELSLRESEERFKRLSIASFEGIAITEKGVIIDSNSQLAEMLGYELNEIIGTGVSNLVFPEDRELVSSMIKKRYDKPYEHRCLRKDGEVIYVEVRGISTSFKGKTVRLTAIRDITERKLAEEELRSSEEKFHKTFMASPYSMAISRLADGLIVDVNEGFERNIGFSADEVIGKPMTDIAMWSNVEESQLKMRDLLSTHGNVRDMEVEFIRKDGQKLYSLISAEIIDLKGEKHLVSIGNNITERKKVEAALRESEERYRTLVDHAEEGIIVVQDNSVLFVNPYLLRITGYSETEFMSRPFIEFVHPDDRKLIMEIHKNRLKGLEIPSLYTLKGIDKKGDTMLLENNGILINWEGKPATLNFLRDITDKVKAEEKIRKGEERLAGFMNSASDSFYLLDAGLNFIEINQKGLDLIGKEKDFVIDKNIADIVPDIKESGRYDKHLEVIRTGKPFIVDDFVPHPVFGNLHFVLKSFKVGDGLGVIASDITERKRAEDSLRLSEERYRNIVQSPIVGVAIMDDNLKFEFANDRLLEIFPISNDEAIGSNLLDYLTEKSMQKVLDNREKRLRGEDVPSMYEIETIDRNGKILTSQISVSLQKGADGKYKTHVHVIDVTERKIAEQKHQESLELMNQTARLASIGVLAGGVRMKLTSL